MSGHFQLAGEALERPRDVADLLHAVLAAAFAAHELQIIHDEQVEAVSRPANGAPWCAARGPDRPGVSSMNNMVLDNSPRRPSA